MADAGAAIAAAQVLAFYKEPVRYRPRLTHGHEVFAGGHHVFRFAQGRFPHSLLRDLSPAERERLREAAAFFIRQVCFWDGATHYQVLSLPPDARRDAIKEHYHALIALIHPDRQEHAAGWPTGAAQRVNLAYSTLLDDDARAAYDAAIRRQPRQAPDGEHAAVHPTPALVRRRSANSLERLRRPVLLVGAVVASLFFAQVWWAGELPREYAVLSSATPFDLSARWVRESLSGERRTRMVETAAAAPPGEALPTRNVAPISQVRAPRPGEAVMPASKVEPGSATARETPTSAATQALPRAAPPNEPRHAAPAAPVSAPVAVTIAQAPPAPAAAAMNEPAARQAISALEMEALVARLVTYYEAGDLERLLSLYDPASVGVWGAMRLRHDFETFFRSTKVRRLRLDRVAWQLSGEVARAQGKATLTAEYHDEQGKVERAIDLELEALLRAGQPMITRLTLFPHG